MSTPSFRRMEPTNAAWSGLESRRVFLGLDVPSVADMQEAARGLLAAPSPVSLYLDHDRRRQRELSAKERGTWSSDMVVAGTPNTGTVLSVLGELDAPLDHQPFRILVGSDWLGMRMSHAVADGRSCLMLLAHLLEVARDGVTHDPPWTVVGRYRRDLLTGRMLAKRPGRLLEAWRQRQELGGGPYGVWAGQQAASQHTTVHRSSPPGFLRRLRAERDRSWPSASSASVVLCGLRSRLRDRGLDPLPGVEMVFDVRRESPATTDAFGNWSAGVYVRPEDDESPESVSAAIAETRTRGYPVIAVAAARRRGHQGRRTDRPVVAPSGRPRLALSYINSHGPVALLPWSTSGGGALAVSAPPNGPGTITLAAQEIGDRLHLSVSLYDSCWPVGELTGAIEDFLTGPPALARVGGTQ